MKLWFTRIARFAAVLFLLTDGPYCGLGARASRPVGIRPIEDGDLKGDRY